MEAVPRLPMISFDLKVSTEIVSFGSKLKQYISSFYHEDPELYQNEIHSLETLRAAAVRPSIDVAGCQLLKKYYCQLHFLKSRFPMEENQSCAVYFSWRDSYSNMGCSVPDIDFELMNILYDIGAIHSKLGASDSRVNPEGMKMACTHFQCAAWAFQTVRETFPQMISLVLTPEVIHFMHLTCLAQAQECILEKSMMDNRKATIIAKVAVQVVDYYKQALSTMQTSGEEGSLSDLVGSRTFKDWIKYLNFKVAYHKCIALLYQGQQAEEQQKMGERVAFYQAASDQLQEAYKKGSSLSSQQEIAEALSFTGDVVEGKRKAAKNENEFIYHEDVPERDALQEVKGASLVKGIAFNINDAEVSGPDIFARLVPMEAHEASSLYSEQKAQMLRHLGEVVENKDRALAEFMSSMQLDVLSQMQQASGLTQDIVDRAAAVAAKPTATQDLVSAMGKLSNTFHDVEAMLNEIDALLKEEEKKEQEYQAEMGSRPPGIIVTDLRREFAKYKEAHAKASDSNQNLHRAMTTHIANLKVLALPLAQLKEQIPSVELPHPDVDTNSIREMEQLLMKVEEMKNQRSMLWAQLRDAIQNDDITSLLVTRPPEKSLEELFQQELQKHQRQATLIEQNMAAQENILKAVIDAYARFTNTRRYLQDVISKRSATISALVNSYDTYDDLLAKANKGLDFYNKLETNVTKLLQRIKSTCKVQDEEREQMLAKSKKPTMTTPTPPVTKAGPKLKDYLDIRKAESISPANYAMGVASNQIPEQAWPPAVRPAPVGSESDIPTYTGEQGYNFRNTNVAPAYYNNYVTTAGATLPNASTTYSGHYAPVPQYSEKNVEQDLSERMAALILKGGSNPDVAMQPNAASYQYGYAGNVSGQDIQSAQNQNLYYQANYGVSLDPAASQYAGYPYHPYTPSNYMYTTTVQTYSDHSYASSMPPTNTHPSYAYTNPISSNYQTSDVYGASQANYGSISTPSQANYTVSSTPKGNYPTGNIPSQGNYPSANTPSQGNCPSVNNPNQSYPTTTNAQSNYPTSTPANAQLNYSSASNTQLSYSNPQQSGNNQQFYPSNASVGYQITADTLPSYSYKSPLSSNLQSDVHGQAISASGYTYPAASQDSQFQNVQGTYSQQNIQGYESSDAYNQSYASSYQAPTSYNQTNYTTQASGTDVSQNYTQTGSYPTQPTQDLQPTQPAQNLQPSGTDITQNYGQYLSQNEQKTPYMYNGQTDNAAAYAASYGYQYGVQYAAQSVNGSANYNQANTQQYGTYSTGQSGNVSTIQPVDQTKIDKSNVDLLSGLDFSINQAPLVPQQNKETPPNPDTPVAKTEAPAVSLPKSSTAVQDEKPAVAFKEFHVTDKGLVEKLQSDAFQKPEVVKQFVQEVEKFEKFVDLLTTKTLNGPTPLDLKWKEIQDKQEIDQQKKSISVARCYPMKNRYPDILPYDQTRVKLTTTKDDYINASFVKDITPNAPLFILSQSPTQSTFYDFWTLVWEEDIELIVCLVGDHEIEQDIYWPKAQERPCHIGNMTVSLQSATVRESWTDSLICISKLENRVSKTVRHLQFTAWPSSLPPTTSSVISYVQEIIRNPRALNQPLLVHCVAGIGRSGFFCLVLSTIIEVLVNPVQLPDLTSIVVKLCNTRRNALRDREHFKFAYHVILDYLKELCANRAKTRKLSEDSKPQANVVVNTAVFDPLNELDPLWATKKDN